MQDKKIWLSRVHDTAQRCLNPDDGSFNQHLNGRLVDCSYEEDWVEYSFRPQDWQRNDRGWLHGGAIAGILDAAMGVSAYIAAEGPVTAVAEMHVSFLAPVLPDDDVHVRVYTVRSGRTIIRLRADLTDGTSGPVLAMASGAFSVIGPAETESRTPAI